MVNNDKGRIRYEIESLVFDYTEDRLAMLKSEAKAVSGLIRANIQSHLMYLPLYRRYWLSFKDDCYQETLFVLSTAIDSLSKITLEPRFQIAVHFVKSKRFDDSRAMQAAASSCPIVNHSKLNFFEEAGLIASLHVSKIPNTLESAYCVQELLFGLRMLVERMNGIFVLHHIQHKARGEETCHCFDLKSGMTGWDRSSTLGL